MYDKNPEVALYTKIDRALGVIWFVFLIVVALFNIRRISYDF